MLYFFSTSIAGVIKERNELSTRDHGQSKSFRNTLFQMKQISLESREEEPDEGDQAAP